MDSNSKQHDATADHVQRQDQTAAQITAHMDQDRAQITTKITAQTGNTLDTLDNLPMVDRGYRAATVPDKHFRRDCGFLARQYRTGAIGLSNTTQEQRDAAYQDVLEIMARARACSNDRAKLAAVKLWQEVEAHNLRMAEALDKAQRLDNDQATDNVQFGPIGFRGGKNVVRVESHTRMEPD